MEYYAVDQLYPEWNVFEQFVHDDFFKAMALDALASSHPVHVPVRVAAEIDEIFDAISYSKGCCCVRMLINWLSNERFREGMIHYLKKFSYQNADTEDLWEALYERTSQNVTEMMYSWIYKIGFPVVSITEEIQQDHKVLTLRQNRFLEKCGIFESDDTVWVIPVSYLVCGADDSITEFSLELKERETKVSIPTSSKWIKFNKNQTAFFRLNYQSDSYYSSLVEPIKSKILSPIDRMSIIEDACTLSKAGLVPTERVFVLFSAYANEDNFTVISSLATCFGTLYNIYKHEEQIIEKFKKLAVSIFSGIAAKLSWVPKPNESHLDSMARPIVLGALVKYGDKAAIEKATQLFDDFRKDNNLVIPDLRPVIYSAVIRYGNEERFNQCLEIFQKTELFEEKNRILRALGLAQDEKLISKSLTMAIDDSVRSQDVMYVLAGVSSNPKATTMAWKFLFENFAIIKQKFEGCFLPGRIVKLLTESVTNADDVQTIRETLDKVKFKSIERSVDQCVESIEINSKWLQRSKNSVLEWLSNNVE